MFVGIGLQAAGGDNVLIGGIGRLEGQGFGLFGLQGADNFGADLFDGAGYGGQDLFQLDDMIAERGLDDIADGPRLHGEDGVVELLDHAAPGKRPQVAAPGLGGVFRQVLGQGGEILAAAGLGQGLFRLFQLRRLVLGGTVGVSLEQDMPGLPFFRNLVGGLVFLVAGQNLLIGDGDTAHCRFVGKGQVFELDLLLSLVPAFFRLKPFGQLFFVHLDGVEEEIG